MGRPGALTILGVDFTSAPRRAKPITAARGRLERGRLVVDAVERLEDFAAFEALLARPGPWIGGFDFPFGLPAELVRDLGWPREWRALVAHCARLSRDELRAAFPDLQQFAGSCRFTDCSHAHEPDCAVHAAVAAGRLSAARHASWLRLLGGDDP